MTREYIETWLAIKYLVTIILDRYNGSYSGAKFIAYPQEPYEICNEVNSDDIACLTYWNDFSSIIGKGNTPNEAYEDLLNNMKKEYNVI